ncbi:MAG: 4-(cytidine 5'-diphospho)-2-C-methyl-D-erythritol kinase [Spirochaetales bacterium]|nr:4-(cytidine 5'-diphospho)-2-C-methyl-D-erythritol kinase [Spirochaetales bacterium]
MDEYEIDIPAPAKINLHLEIQDKRKDGYHNLTSIFIAVSLFDRLVIRSLKDNYRCIVSGDFELKNKYNIVVRAYNRFAEKTGIKRGVSVFLKKNIPIGAGLGGGSSDAAAMIKGLNMLFNTGLSHYEKMSLAAHLGSDVPFFLNGAAALVKGKGNIIKQLIPRTEFTILLVNSGIRISTKDAFSELDELKYENRKTLSEGFLINSYYNKEIKDWRFYNSFYPILTENKKLQDIEKAVRKTGPAFYGFSGSGSTFFCIFLDRKEAALSLTKLKKMYSFVKLCKPLDVMPKAILKLNVSEAT